MKSHSAVTFFPLYSLQGNSSHPSILRSIGGGSSLQALIGVEWPTAMHNKTERTVNLIKY